MELKHRTFNLFKTFNFFWAAALLLMLMWIEASKAVELNVEPVVHGTDESVAFSLAYQESSS